MPGIFGEEVPFERLVPLLIFLLGLGGAGVLALLMRHFLGPPKRNALSWIVPLIFLFIVTGLVVGLSLQFGR